MCMMQIANLYFRSVRYLLAGLTILLSGACALAGTHTWTGAGTSGYWSTAANWAGGAPTAGEVAPVVLVFPSGAARLANTNNISGLTLHGMTISGAGYTLHGAGGGSNITFATYSGVDYYVTANNNLLANSLIISLSGSPLLSVSGALRIQSKLTGSGGFTKLGTGPLNLECIQANTYAGTTTVTGGSLNLSGGYQLFDTWIPSVMVPGPLVIGGSNMVIEPNVLLLHSEQIADDASVTLNPNAYFYLGGNDETIGSLTMTGGSLYGDSLETSLIGTLTLGGNVIAPYTPLINGVITANVNLGGVTRTINVSGGDFIISGSIDDGASGRVQAGITKTGAGTLRLDAATNTYNGATLVSAGTLVVSGTGGLGMASAGTTVNSGATLMAEFVNVTGEPITLNGHPTIPALTGFGNSSFAGQITLAGDSIVGSINTNYTLTLSGPITGAGGMSLLGNVAFTGTSNNTFSGALKVQGTNTLTLNKSSGATAVSGPLFIGHTNSDPGLHSPIPSAYVRLSQSHQIADTASVTIYMFGELSLGDKSEAIGLLTFYNGGISGYSSGLLTLSGNVTNYGSPYNSYPRGAHIWSSVSLGGQTRTFNALGGAISLNNRVIDGGASAGITKIGPEDMDLVASNSYSGLTLVNEGVLNVSDGHALGQTNAGTIVAIGARLRLGWYFDAYSPNANDFYVGEALTLNGNPWNLTALSCAGTNTWTGPIYLASDCLIDCAFYMTNVVLNLACPISGPGGLTLARPINVRLTGSANNTFSGPLVVEGRCQAHLGKSSGAVAVPGTLFIGETLGEVNSAIVRLNASEQIANSANVNLLMTGQLDLASYNETIGPLTCDSDDTTDFLGGNIVGTGTLTLTDNATNNGWGDVAIHCPVSLGGQTRRFMCEVSGFDLHGRVSDGGPAAGIIAQGPWPLNLFGANTYSGPTTTTWGQIGVHHNQALGSTAGGTFVSEYGTLRLYDVQVSGESLVCSNVESYALSYVGLNSWSGPVRLESLIYFASSVLPPLGTEQLVLSGPVSGPGGLLIGGAGEVTLGGATPNSYTGETWAWMGRLRLNKPAGVIAVPGSLEIGEEEDHYKAEVVLNANNQINPVAPVTINHSGLLDLNNFSNTLGPLTFNSGHLSTGTGTASLAGNVTVNLYTNQALIEGRIYLPATRTFDVAAGSYSPDLRVAATVSGPGGITKTGMGEMRLVASNSFAGLTTVGAGNLVVGHSSGLGVTNTGTVVSEGADLFVGFGAQVGLESLILHGSGDGGDGALISGYGSNSWAGAITLAGDVSVGVIGASAFLNLSGPISGTGNLTNTDISQHYLNEESGTLIFSGAAPNTFAGNVSSQAGTLLLNKSAYNGAVPHGLRIGGTVRLLAPNQIADSADVQVSGGGLLDLATAWDWIDTLHGPGTVRFGNGGFLGVGMNGGSSQFDGPMTGLGYAAGWTLAKYGAGTFTVTGNNTFSAGQTHVFGGKLVVNGLQPQSTVVLDPGTTLAGTGTVGPIQSHGGTINPGASPGRLRVIGNAILDGASKLRLDLFGIAPGTGYDQLQVTGDLAANEATLELVLGFAGAISNQYTIVDHPTGWTSTLFKNLPNGGIVTTPNGAQFSIAYAAGDGNDTVLTQLSAPPLLRVITANPLADGNRQVVGTGMPDQLHTIHSCTNLSETNWQVLGATTASDIGQILFNDLQSTNHPHRFYRLSLP